MNTSLEYLVQEGKTTLVPFHHTFVDAKYFVSDLKFYKGLRYPTEENSSQPLYRTYTTETKYLDSFTVLVSTSCVNPCKNGIFFFGQVLRILSLSLSL